MVGTFLSAAIVLTFLIVLLDIHDVLCVVLINRIHDTAFAFCLSRVLRHIR